MKSANEPQPDRVADKNPEHSAHRTGMSQRHPAMRRVLGLLPREERWRARSVCRAMRTAVHGMPELAFWLALTAGPLSGVVLGAARPPRRGPAVHPSCDGGLCWLVTSCWLCRKLCSKTFAGANPIRIKLKLTNTGGRRMRC